MATLTLDTLKLARKLEAGGFTREQSAAAAEALADTFTAGAGEIATKADVIEGRREFKETELRLEARIESAKAEILKWMFGVALAQIGAIVALLKLIP